MPIAIWDASFSIGVPEIDAQHQRLMALVNEVEAAILEHHGAEIAAKALRTLCDYAVEHFAAEEALMDMDSYADYDKHMGAHMDGTTKALEFLQAVGEDKPVDMQAFLAYLSQWVREHIMEMDQGLGRHLRATGRV
ncbi:bacteriohemerythrin [Humidesulfovibrio sp.]